MGPANHNIMKIKLLCFLFILTIIGLSCEDSKLPDKQFSVILTLKRGGLEILVEEFVFKSNLNIRIDITETNQD